MGIYRAEQRGDKSAMVPERDEYVAGFLAGQAVAYCEMVTRGVRLAGQLDVPSQACDTLAQLVYAEGCMARIVTRDTGRAALWVYREHGVERLIDAFESSLPTPNDVAIWGMGKLLGYGDQDVLTFCLHQDKRTTSMNHTNDRVLCERCGKYYFLNYTGAMRKHLCNLSVPSCEETTVKVGEHVLVTVRLYGPWMVLTGRDRAFACALADLIHEYKWRGEEPQSAAAVDPHAANTGTPTTRV